MVDELRGALLLEPAALEAEAAAELPRRPAPGPAGAAARAAALAAGDVGLWFGGVAFMGWAPLALSRGALAALLAGAALWRWARCRAAARRGLSLPYSCGTVAADGRELFLVATMHISPRAPADVRAVIAQTQPDITMIELDEERLDRLRQCPAAPRLEELQELELRSAGGAASSVRAQRAVWNAERAGEVVCGAVLFDEANACGLEPLSARVRGRLLLVYQGLPRGHEPVPLLLRAHRAARAGAAALLLVGGDRLPSQRLGEGPLWEDLRAAMAAGDWGFPRIPVLLLPRGEGEKLRAQCGSRCPRAGTEGAEEDSEAATAGGAAEDVVGSFRVLPDNYPRRALRKRLCQSCALTLSGIGVLYSVIRCFRVQVGGEFLAAVESAAALGIPCTCIDVDMDKFWARMAGAVVPRPGNLWSAVAAWLAMPRVLLRILFPPDENVDVLGTTMLQIASLPLRTWTAFVIAGLAASMVMTAMLGLLSSVPVRGAEAVGAVRKEDLKELHAWTALLVQLYLLPRIYDAVAASRDEAMYQSILTTSRERGARRLVVVVGAGHANGILQRARTLGL